MARVMIVDDSAGIRMMLKAIMQSAGHEIVGAFEDGEAGVAHVEALQPDLLLLDMLMPRMDGIETLRKVREKAPRTQVIMISSVCSTDRILAAREAGAFHYLLKPFNAPQLIAIANRCLAVSA